MIEPLELGGIYRPLGKPQVTIMVQISPASPLYGLGYRWIGDNDIPYTLTGRIMKDGITPNDLTIEIAELEALISWMDIDLDDLPFFDI